MVVLLGMTVPLMVVARLGTMVTLDLVVVVRLGMKVTLTVVVRVVKMT